MVSVPGLSWLGGAAMAIPGGSYMGVPPAGIKTSERSNPPALLHFQVLHSARRSPSHSSTCRIYRRNTSSTPTSSSSNRFPSGPRQSPANSTLYRWAQLKGIILSRLRS